MARPGITPLGPQGPAVIEKPGVIVPYVDPLATLPEWWALLAGGAGSSSGSYGDNRNPVTNAISPDTLLPVCFGQVRVGGTMLYVQGVNSSYTDGQGVIAWCEGEIESIDAITGGGGGFSARSDDWVTIAVNQHRGEPGGDTNPGNIFGTIKPSFAGCAYTHFQVTVPSYLYRWWWTYVPGGFSNPSNSSGGIDDVPWAADVHGLKLYDPRLDSTNGGSGSHRYNDPTTWTYSNNPILISRYLLVKYGHLLNAVDIEDSNISAMAQASDDAGFTCNVVFAAKTLVRDALSVVLQTCNGQPITVNGKAGFYLDIPNPGASVGTFSEEAGDIWGLKYEWLSARDRYTQYAVSFNNAAANYKPDQTPIFGDPATFSSEPTVAVSSVNTGTDTLTMASSPGWSVNDTVIFFQNGGVAIPGLFDGTTYYVKTIFGAAVTLALVASGTVINLTGTPVITTQYLQRVGTAYPPTMVVKLLAVAAPGINTLAAAIILRDYLYNAAAITFRISGTMNARGIGLQQGQKIHLTTLKNVDVDALLVQISGDQFGFFSFVVKPYVAGVYGSTPITQGPPIVTSTRPNDINVTDRTQTLQILTSTDSTHDNYDVFQLVEYVLPLNYAATIDHLAVRGSEAAGAQSQQWGDLAASEISVSTAGNATATDGTHENLYHTAIRRATRVITYSTRPTILTDVITEKTTRVIVKSIGADGGASGGVTVDYTAGVGPSAPPTAPPPAGITSPLVIPPSGTATGLGGEIQMKELVAGGSNVTGFGAPDALAGDLRYVLPATAPSIDGEALVFDSGGTYAGRKLLKFELPYVEKLMIETPSGSWTGRTYTLSQLPMTAKIVLIVDNMPLKGGFDFGRSGQTVTLASAANKPVNSIIAIYSYRAQVGSAVSSSESVSLVGTASTWSAETMPTSTWVRVIWVPSPVGLFVAASGDNPLIIATSPDGVTWTQQTYTGTISYATGMVYANGLITIFVDGIYNRTITSPDGIAWTINTTTGTANQYGGPSVWAASLSKYLICRSANAGYGPFFTSTDGIAWVDRGNGGGCTANILTSMCWSPELGLAVGVGNNEAVYSSDGITWANATAPANSSTGSTNPKCVIWVRELGLFVQTGSFHDTGPKSIATSPDGITWTLRTTPTPGAYGAQGVAWSAARQLLVAVCGDSSTWLTAIWTSPDGINWTQQTTPDYRTGRWIACGDSPDVIVVVGASDAQRAIISLS
jgi:hypothetical protein